MRLLGAFAATFVMSGIVTATAVVADAHWATLALLVSFWMAALILVLFLYAYRRALALINPSVQLSFILADAEKDLKVWSRRATRLSPLLETRRAPLVVSEEDAVHDIPRTVYFQLNPQWTTVARQSIAYAVSFARRYGEQSDYEVMRGAIATIVTINGRYVQAKGRTFFQSNPILNVPMARDSFISDTLEQLRLASSVAVGSGDEEQIKQFIVGFSALAATYSTIDYASRTDNTKQDANLAAAYLTGVVESAAAKNLPDVMMEGLRQMGGTAGLIMRNDPSGSTILIQRISTLALIGVVKENHRPVTLTGMEQLARLTRELIRSEHHDVAYCFGELRNAVYFVAKQFLNVPNPRLDTTHQTYLAPYFTLTQSGTFPEWLAIAANELNQRDAGDEVAIRVIGNIEEWADGLYQPHKELLLVALEKRSPFSFDAIHWTAHVVKCLIAVARTPAGRYEKQDLDRHASWLISIFSFIPEDNGTVECAANYGVVEQLFEVAADAFTHDANEIGSDAIDLLVDWSFKAGQHRWSHFEAGLSAAVAAALIRDDQTVWLTQEVRKRFGQRNIPRETCERTARALRERVQLLRRRRYPTSRVEAAYQRIDRGNADALLNAVADILTANAPGQPNQTSGQQ